MIKSLIRIFLLFCIIPLSGYSIAHVHSYPSPSGFSSKTQSKEYHNNFNSANSTLAFFNASKSSKENGFEISIADVTENEDRLIASDKYLKNNNNFFIAVILSLVIVALLLSAKLKLSVFNRLSGVVSGKKYLMVHAIRI